MSIPAGRTWRIDKVNWVLVQLSDKFRMDIIYDKTGISCYYLCGGPYLEVHGLQSEQITTRIGVYAAFWMRLASRLATTVIQAHFQCHSASWSKAPHGQRFVGPTHRCQKETWIRWSLPKCNVENRHVRDKETPHVHVYMESNFENEKLTERPNENRIEKERQDFVQYSWRKAEQRQPRY